MGTVFSSYGHELWHTTKLAVFQIQRVTLRFATPRQDEKRSFDSIRVELLLRRLVAFVDKGPLRHTAVLVYK